MKTICAPSHVMREGRDLNQHGQAGRQEQASSSSPVIFHEVLLGAAAAPPGRPSAVIPHTIATQTTDLPVIICFINFFLSLRRSISSGECIPARGAVNIERAGAKGRGEFKKRSRRREEADFGAKNTSASIGERVLRALCPHCAPEPGFARSAGFPACG